MKEIVPSDSQVPAEKKPEDLSPFDPEYPAALLSHSLQRRMDQAQRAAERVYNAVIKNAPVAAQVQQATKKGFRLVVDATDSTLEAIDSGKIKLTVEKGGKTFAQIKNGNKYGEKLPIKRETFARGIDPVQMANAMQMRAIQEQMQQISHQIKSIDHSVREVIQGQQNDRIALYYSGASLYLEACRVNDPEIKKALIAQALRGLSEATFQLTLKIQDDIKTGPIPDSRAPSVRTFDRKIVLFLALIPAAIGLMGMAQMYEREYKKGTIFLIGGLILFIPMITIIAKLGSFGDGTFFAAMGLVFFIILYIVGYVIQAFDALIRSIIPIY